MIYLTPDSVSAFLIEMGVGDPPAHAFAKGARVVKVRTERSDGHANGSKATVIAWLGHSDVGEGYFVEWDDHPNTAVFVIGWKLSAA